MGLIPSIPGGLTSPPGVIAEWRAIFKITKVAAYQMIHLHGNVTLTELS